MTDTLVLRTATAIDAPAVAATIAAAFEQYRGKLVPESGAFNETVDTIAKELATGTGAIIAEMKGAIVGCVMIRPYEGDLYFGRLSDCLPHAARVSPPASSVRSKTKRGRATCPACASESGLPSSTTRDFSNRWGTGRFRARPIRASTTRPRSTCARHSAEDNRT
jgi:hypothetical protein